MRYIGRKKTYRGVIISTRIVDGTLRVGDKIRFMQTNATYEVTELMINTPKEVSKKELTAGEVGFIAASIKNISDIKMLNFEGYL